jgi:DNA-directed RNA polymerase specialized sigma24 family protein
MHEVITDEDLADERLAELARAGEESAFNQLYERWFEQLHDFAARILLDRSRATGVVRRAFAATLRTGRRSRCVQDTRLALYAKVREEAIRRSRRRRRRAGSDPAFLMLDVGRLLHPESTLPDAELVDLAWDAAVALSASDYALLDLHLRQELTAAELARILGVSREVVCERLAALRDALDAAVLDGGAGRAQAVSAVEVFGALSLVPAPGAPGEAVKAWQRRGPGGRVVVAGVLGLAVFGGAAAAMALVGGDDAVLRDPTGARARGPASTNSRADGSSGGKAAEAKSKASSAARRHPRARASKVASGAVGTASGPHSQVGGGAPRQGSGDQRRAGHEDQPRSSSPDTRREPATDSKPRPAPQLQLEPSDPAPRQEVLVPQDPQPPSEQPTSAPER